ncbi:SET and MYND domain containing class 4 member 3 [Carabus blaptoides fortunei]
MRVIRELIRKFIYTRIEYGKDANKSQSLRQVGNEYYAKQDYVNAMVSYNESLEFAPPDSFEFAMALASRSTVLFELKRYKDCLVDDSRVLRSKYPKLLMHTVYIRQAKCFMELNSHNAVRQVLLNFKQWMHTEQENLSTKNIQYMTDNIRDIQNSLENRSETVFVVESVLTLPIVTDGENQKFAYASKRMQFKKNAQSFEGKHVMANSDVKKGDILFVEEPYSTSCTSTHSGYFTYCNQCFISSMTCIPASQTGFKTSAKSDGESYGNKKENFPYVNQLLTHKMEMAEWNLTYKTKEAALMLVYLIEYTDYINWLYTQEYRPKVSRDAVYKVFGNILLKTLLQIGSNSETVLHSFVMFEDKFSPGLNYHNIALGLYVSSCLMNHSCLPNAMRR